MVWDKYGERSFGVQLVDVTQTDLINLSSLHEINLGWKNTEGKRNDNFSLCFRSLSEDSSILYSVIIAVLLIVKYMISFSTLYLTIGTDGV